MSQVVAGEDSDLTTSNAKIVLQMIQDNWPETGFTPNKSQVAFSDRGYSSVGTYQISFRQTTPTTIEITSLGGTRQKHEAFVDIDVWELTNEDQRSDTVVFAMTNKVETIINTNTRNMPHGITSITIPNGFSAIDSGTFRGDSDDFENEIEESLFHSQGTAVLTYYKVITMV